MFWQYSAIIPIIYTQQYSVPVTGTKYTTNTSLQSLVSLMVHTAHVIGRGRQG